MLFFSIRIMLLSFGFLIFGLSSLLHLLILSHSKSTQMMTLEKQYHDELKMELQGMQYSSSASDLDKQKSDEYMESREESLPDMPQISNDAADMSKLLMSRKKRGLYEAMKVILLIFCDSFDMCC